MPRRALISVRRHDEHLGQLRQGGYQALDALGEDAVVVGHQDACHFFSMLPPVYASGASSLCNTGAAMWLSRPTQSVYRIAPRIPSIPFPPLRGGRGRPLPLSDRGLVL